MRNLVWSIVIVLSTIACQKVNKEVKLPVYGNPKILENSVGDETVYDTIPHTIQYFRLFNQDSTVITPESLGGKIYVADFFFTSCPTICPKMKTQMLRLYKEFKNTESFILLSHSIDPEYDTVALLRDYANRLEVESSKWMFLTGDKDEIYELGESSYMVTTSENEEVAGGYIHSGAFILVDTKKRIRGVYDGTEPDQVDILIKDIHKLIDEERKI